MALNKLPTTTIKRLHSSQVISSVFCAVKELVENSLDSGATSIEVKLINYGLDSIEVQDNGSGVPSSHVKFMCLPHYTSKISDFSDLGTKLETYGFRGEALSSLCNVSTVTVVTRTNKDEYASNYSFDNSGQVIDVNPSHFGIGTTVIALNIFSNLPVRKRYMSSSYRLKTELKKIETMVKNLSIVNYQIGFTFCHNLKVKWQKSHCTTVKESISSVMGYTFGSQLDEISTDQTMVNAVNSITLLLPKQNCHNFASICLPEGAVRIFINQRPVEYKKLQKVVVKCFNEHLNFLQGKIPFSVINIKVPPNCVDVNIEPNKTRLMCHNEDELITAIERLMTTFYGLSRQEVPKPINKLDKCGDKSAVPKNVAEYFPIITTNSSNSSCSNQHSKNNNLSHDTMALWSRGHVANPENQDIIPGGASLLKRRAGLQEELTDDSHEATLLESKRKCCNEFPALKKPSNYFTLDSVCAKKTPSISNNRGQLINKTIGLSDSSNSTSASPKNQNNTVSEMFKNSCAKEEGEVKKSLSWYVPAEKSLKKSTKIWDIVANDWNGHSNVNDQVFPTATQSVFEIQLLDQLPNGIWMYKCGKSIGTIRHWCIKENKLYEQFLRCGEVPVNRLQTPIVVSRKDFTPDQWQNLLAMNIEDECTDNEMYISNEIISKNGLKLAWMYGEMFITHIASTINFSGLEELREILTLLNSTTDLSQCRPAKVRAFFKSEAVRTSHRKDALKREEMETLLNYCPDQKAFCHGKAIFVLHHKFQ